MLLLQRQRPHAVLVPSVHIFIIETVVHHISLRSKLGIDTGVSVTTDVALCPR
jgi:hypothetical protein